MHVLIIYNPNQMLLSIDVDLLKIETAPCAQSMIRIMAFLFKYSKRDAFFHSF